MSGDRARLIRAADAERRELRGPSRSGTVTILSDPETTGASSYACGAQQLPPGAQIPIHRHPDQEEALLFQGGQGEAFLGHDWRPVSTGDTLHIPAGVWHGVRNVGEEALSLTWIISPPGLERMFRAISEPDGEPALPLSDAEFLEIATACGMEYPDHPPAIPGGLEPAARDLYRT